VDVELGQDRGKVMVSNWKFINEHLRLDHPGLQSVSTDIGMSSFSDTKTELEEGSLNFVQYHTSRPGPAF
jgi:hypothetical protein